MTRTKTKLRKGKHAAGRVDTIHQAPSLKNPVGHDNLGSRKG